MRQVSGPRTTKVSVRFWIELVTGVLSALAFAVTTIWPQWIEAVFGADPDGGSGEAEWGLTAGLCVFALVMLIAARREWKRASMAGSMG